jgi:hypothetical protein
MIQHCDVYINIFCAEEHKLNLSEYLRNYFDEDSHLYIEGNLLAYLEIVDDAKELIVLDLEVDVDPLVKKDSCFCSKFVTFEDYLEKEDFVYWVKKLIPASFDVEIEIDDNSNIPTEEELMKEYIEESESYLYND